MTKYDQLKERLGIKVQPRHVFTFDHDYVGTEKADRSSLGGSKQLPKPPIEEDLSRFQPNRKAVQSARGWWAKLTPRQRKAEVMKRRRNGAAGRVKR
jgi:ABC-type uncharacterized transport system ATPase subunit